MAGFPRLHGGRKCADGLEMELWPNRPGRCKKNALEQGLCRLLKDRSWKTALGRLLSKTLWWFGPAERQRDACSAASHCFCREPLPRAGREPWTKKCPTSKRVEAWAISSETPEQEPQQDQSPTRPVSSKTSVDEREPAPCPACKSHMQEPAFKIIAVCPIVSDQVATPGCHLRPPRRSATAMLPVVATRRVFLGPAAAWQVGRTMFLVSRLWQPLALSQAEHNSDPHARSNYVEDHVRFAEPIPNFRAVMHLLQQPRPEGTSPSCQEGRAVRPANGFSATVIRADNDTHADEGVQGFVPSSCLPGWWRPSAQASVPKLKRDVLSSEDLSSEEKSRWRRLF